MKLQLQNITRLFKNIRTRSIIILTGCILLFGFLYGYIHLSKKSPVEESSIQLKGSPANIQSVPGGVEQSPSADYQRLQAQQNLEQAAIAEKTGASAIPTLLDSNQFNQIGQSVNGSSPCPSMNNGCSPCDACAKYMACAGVQLALTPVSSLQPSQLKSGTLIYDTQGKVIGHLGVDGKVRDANGQIIGQVGPDGLVRSEDGTVIGSAAVPAMGDAVYDVAGRLIGTVGRDGKVRDAKGRVIGVVGPDGIVRNLKGAVIGKVVVPKASIVIPAYDKKGHLIGTVDADGKLRDANGHIIGEVDADGSVRNAEGDIIGKTGVNMTGAPVYDPEGHLLGTIGADGKLRDAAGNIIGEVDANGVVHNPAGKIIGHAYLKGTHEKRHAIPGTPVYDHQGKLLGTLDSDAEVRNAQGKVIGKLDTDGLVRGLHGEIIGKLGATAPGTPVYDKLGHLVGTVGSDGIVRDVQGKALGKLGADGIVRDSQGNPIGSITPPHRNTTALPSNDNNATTTNAAVSLLSETTNKPNPELQAILDRQAQQISAQKADQLQQQMQGSMSTQASQLFAAWTSPNQQYVAGTPDLNRLGAGLGGALTGSPAGARAPAVKAGTIMYAVLLTAVNSDEPGPVLAEIVQGKFKGARIMGTLSNQGQKVLLSFNTLTLPKLSESVAINTVAIDENTARTALSSDTNNHYWLRYGTLFASAFIQGYGQSFINSAPNYNISLFPSPTPDQPQKNNLSPRDRVFVGLGQVGLQYSSVLRNIFNTPPTVKVFSGTPMGILFLSDLAALPTS
ncbi:TrbI/VirB10 family protein [Rickettsiella endosymbiont of Aleochara curtula]|uniref:TrbI/VirB10 family protein n=1 Tax=Rickettsiella endosymbiont of Aleochara curtula TaxID=3077936 RepID=UPI00313E76C1